MLAPHRPRCGGTGLALPGVHSTPGVTSLPGKHDAKDVHVIGQLHALGRSAPWPLAESAARDLRVLVDEATVFKARLNEDYNPLEAWLARRWPELACWIDLRTSSTLALLARCTVCRACIGRQTERDHSGDAQRR